MMPPRPSFPPILPLVSAVIYCLASTDVSLGEERRQKIERDPPIRESAPIVGDVDRVVQFGSNCFIRQ